MTAFLLAVGLIFIAAAACGRIAARVGLPRVVGEMVAGLVLGQSLLGRVWPSAERYAFGGGSLDALKQVSLLVVLFYVALVGSELDRSVLSDRRRGLAIAGAVGLVPAIAGAVIVRLALPSFHPSGVPEWTYLVFLTGALLVTAVPVLARILDESGLTGTKVGSVTLGLSIADDFIAFSIIAVAIAVATNGRLSLALAGTALLTIMVVTARQTRGVRRTLKRRPVPESQAIAIALLALVAAAVNELGASTLVAAFVVGALIWRPRWSGPVVQGGDFIRALVPLYIVYAALSVDVSRLFTLRLGVAVLVVTLVAVVSKSLACMFAGRILSLGRTETVGLAVLRNTRGLTELVALKLGYDAGLLSSDLYTVFFSMALLTTAISGAVVTRTLRSLLERQERSGDGVPPPPSPHSGVYDAGLAPSA